MGRFGENGGQKRECRFDSLPFPVFKGKKQISRTGRSEYGEIPKRIPTMTSEEEGYTTIALGS